MWEDLLLVLGCMSFAGLGWIAAARDWLFLRPQADTERARREGFEAGVNAGFVRGYQSGYSGRVMLIDGSEDY